ncbi:MAG: lycopene beta-cyclase CrtY [Thermoanaerobaculales bacterium]|jgi:lycopene beta-cyclase|nr:lycopene beta-cyclase CrtY [Thermoanaerobaculales bacterium]
MGEQVGSTGLVLVGGGLANCLIAYRILSRRPDYPLVVVERGPRLGGNHTWSFHDSDLDDDQREWLAPLLAHRWASHELRFPARRVTIEGGYSSVSSARLHEVVAPALGSRLRLGAACAAIAPERVVLADGQSIEARAVIDGRGDPGGAHLDLGYQKFLGLFVRLREPHRLAAPILMDATVEQVDGYRFVYTLPLSATEALIEDTYYADQPGLDRAALRTAIADYATRRGWEIGEVAGEESGVLPIVLGGDIDAFWADGPPGVARSGMRGAFFHPTTGYSLPEAVRLADEIASLPELESPSLFELTRRRSLELWRRTGYYRLLNRMLFRAAVPELRYRIFERFYGLSPGLIRRFYAGRLKWTDKIRVLTGRPPVPVLRALRCIVESRDRAGTTTRRNEDAQ